MMYFRAFRTPLCRILASKVPHTSPTATHYVHANVCAPLFVHLKSHMCTRPAFHRQPQVDSQSTSVLLSEPKEKDDILVHEAVALAKKWASAKGDRGLVGSLAGDEPAVKFIMKFTDWVMRAEDPKVAAKLMSRLIASHGVPTFLNKVDRILMQLGASIAPWLPSIVVDTARWRMMQFVSGFVGTVENMKLDDGSARNVNLLGEAVLGELEAEKRRAEAEALLKTKGVDYVSVKVSGVTSQLNRWDFDGSLERVLSSLRPLFQQAAASSPQVLVNLDMEEYHDLEITIEAFTRLLEEPQFQNLHAGIVLQTYLPDALPALQKLVAWAHVRPGNGEIKIRLVKGANLAMEKVDAAIHGWEQAPYESKSDTDANYLRCLNWVLTPERTQRVKIGVASHNLFLMAYAHLLAQERGVESRVGFEMLQGMTPAHTPVLAKEGHGMLLYTPVCRKRDFDVAISYLFRRFEEASSDGNFLRSLPQLKAGSPAFQSEEKRFRDAAYKIDDVGVGPRRTQQRPALASAQTLSGPSAEPIFLNEPDTDPCLPQNRAWAVNVLNRSRFQLPSESSKVENADDMNAVLKRARQALPAWGLEKSPTERRAIISSVADMFAKRRGDLINAMVHEGSKTFAEADPEVSEAIDFANYYSMLGEQLPENFKPLGVVAIAAPWNFPVAIGAGGMLAALASGNTAILKPSPSTPRCAELISECAWEAGVPRDALQFVQCADGDLGRELVTKSDAVILTGSSETAKMFRSWKRDIRLFGETSGKNALVISPAADLDLAVVDLAQSAFSNSGQRCSSSSLAICIGSMYESDRFRRQLVDAVTSLKVGYSSDISTVMGPLAVQPEEKLIRALTELEEGEEWLVKPRCMDEDGDRRLWTPGVRLGVKPGSWFHQTEVFGPVLGIMKARDLDEALAMQNGTAYGLTGGIHSLDSKEIDKWAENVEVGNAYVNRTITGAIVRRQCFGGWKASAVGPGAKAGGPNYLTQFGTVNDEQGMERNEAWVKKAVANDEVEWRDHFTKEHDPTGLFCESNIFRYRPLKEMAVRVGPGANEFETARVRAGIERCGVNDVDWSECNKEDATTFAKRMKDKAISRVRVIGETEEELLNVAAEQHMHIANCAVVADGRIELQHYLREQSISRTRHRFGNLVTA